MKLLCATLSCAAMVQAKTINQIATDVMEYAGTKTRSYNGHLLAAVKSMNQMGCWCYFGDDHGRGKGPALDEIDNICKVLSDGYDCAMIDHEEETSGKRGRNAEECVPWAVEYNSGLGGSDAELYEVCFAKNPRNNCAARACIVEGNFISSLTMYFINGGSVQLENKVENGFDPTQMCVGRKGVNSKEKSCCGQYPGRFPFKTLGGERSCCGTRTYNTMALECCDGEKGVIKSSC